MVNTWLIYGHVFIISRASQFFILAPLDAKRRRRDAASNQSARGGRIYNDFKAVMAWFFSLVSFFLYGLIFLKFHCANLGLTRLIADFWTWVENHWTECVRQMGGSIR